MKVLVIGQGSMGKRRVRNTQALNVEDITAFDPDEKKRQESLETYGINVVDKFDDKLIEDADAVIISTPPDIHLEYIEKCLDKNTPCFVEASVVLDGLPEADRRAKEKGVLIAPSCTMRFHPSIKNIKSIVQGGQYGKVTNFTYHSGQYLPDWHPWESIMDYYVSQKKTGGGREIVPFELTWLVDVFPVPDEICAFYGKTFEMGADIDDVYSVLLRYGDSIGSLTVDVTSRFATRNLIVNLEQAQIRWNWEDGVVKVYEAENEKWIDYKNPEGKAAEGYNQNIVEEMYIEEMSRYLDAVNGKSEYPNSLADDIKILEILLACEKEGQGISIK